MRGGVGRLTLHSIDNEPGETIARLESIPIGEAIVALVPKWTARTGVATPGESLPFCARAIAELTERGVRTFATRVVTVDADLDPALTTARATCYRAILQTLGFVWEEDRVEYRLPLAAAIASLGSPEPVDDLRWHPVATELGPEFDRAAALLAAVGGADPELRTPARALGFLLARREDTNLLLSPECIQIGAIGHDDVAIVVPSVIPETGWCSLYYMGVLPAYRGRGLGLETMRRGFSVMASLGGRTYHDGTGATNEAALALFRRLGVPPYRRMEEWSARIPPPSGDVT